MTVHAKDLLRHSAPRPSVDLDGFRKIPTRQIVDEVLKTGGPVKSWEEKSVPLDRGTCLHSIIWERLEDEWRGRVQNRVNEVIEAERVDA